jgi:three-Cys-motif partner protein
MHQIGDTIPKGVVDIMDKYLQPVNDDLPMRQAQPYATEKLDYLSRYMAVFATAMREKFPLRHYIDLFAGPGKNYCTEGNRVLLGSPLLALMLNHPFSHYYFSDNIQENVEALRLRCNASPSAHRVWIQVGDANKLVDNVVADINRHGASSLNLAFLDPEGLELRWGTVEHLASVKRMDLIMYYPEMGLDRNMGRLVGSNSETSIDLFFGTTKWREVYEAWQKDPSRPLHRDLMDLYKSRLGTLGYKEVVEDTELSGNEPLIRNSKGGRLYRLLFASKHELGHDFWGKVMKRDVYGQGRLF